MTISGRSHEALGVLPVYSWWQVQVRLLGQEMITLDQALSKGHGTWRSFTCPVHDDSSPSARVNVVSGKWVCMSCGAKGTTKGYVPDVNLVLEDAMSTLDEVDLEKPESWLDQFDSGPVHPYWLSRFSEETCRAFRLGWDGVNGEPCYPIRASNGLPLGVTLRNISDPEGKKYKYPKKVKTHELVFGMFEAQQTDAIFLCEGAMDVCAVRDAGHDAVGIYGSHISERQVWEIVMLHPREVIIAFDMDRAGHQGAGRAEAMLNGSGVLTRRGFWNDKYNDLGDMDLATRSSTLDNLLASTPTTR